VSCLPSHRQEKAVQGATAKGEADVDRPSKKKRRGDVVYILPNEERERKGTVPLRTVVEKEEA